MFPKTFDLICLRTSYSHWPPADVGFIVSLKGELSCPSPYGRPAARAFYADNGKFVCNVQSAEVYWNSSKNGANLANQAVAAENNSTVNNSSFGQLFQSKNSLPTKQIVRNVVPQQQGLAQDENGISKLFRSVVFGSRIPSVGWRFHWKA